MKGTAEKSDIDSDLFCVDVKLRKRWDVDKWYDELRAYANAHDRIPILTLTLPRAKRWKRARQACL